MRKRPAVQTVKRTSFAPNADDARRMAALLKYEQDRSPDSPVTQTDVMRKALYEMSKKRDLEPKAKGGAK